MKGLENKFSITTYNDASYIESGEAIATLTELISQGTEKRFIFAVDVKLDFLQRIIETTCLDQFDSDNCGLFRNDGSSVTSMSDVFLAKDYSSTYEELKSNSYVEPVFCIDSGNEIIKKTKFNLSDASESSIIEVMEGLFLIRLLEETHGDTDANDNDTKNFPKCITRKTVQPEIRTKLYSACDSDMPCHCKNLNFEPPKFLASMCDIIPKENCSMFPYCEYCQYDQTGLNF